MYNLKTVLKKIKTFLRKVLHSKSPSESHTLSKKFTTVYEENLFQGKESISGPGSDVIQTEVIRAEIPEILERISAESILDAPCGDYFWMRYVNLGDVKYTGVDIVPNLIQYNMQHFADSSHIFLLRDIANDPLPRADLILCRDCLVHLTYQQAQKVIKNFKASGAKYLLTTTFPDRTNKDLGNIIWRPLNLCAPPFNFPAPILLINEKCTEDNLAYTDKSLGLWKLDDLNS